MENLNRRITDAGIPIPDSWHTFKQIPMSMAARNAGLHTLAAWRTKRTADERIWDAVKNFIPDSLPIPMPKDMAKSVNSIQTLIDLAKAANDGFDGIRHSTAFHDAAGYVVDNPTKDWRKYIETLDAYRDPRYFKATTDSIRNDFANQVYEMNAMMGGEGWEINKYLLERNEDQIQIGSPKRISKVNPIEILKRDYTTDWVSPYSREALNTLGPESGYFGPYYRQGKGVSGSFPYERQTAYHYDEF